MELSDFIQRFDKLCVDTATVRHLLESQEKNPQGKDRLLSVEEAAEFLNISKSSLYRLTSERRVPFHKSPGSNRLYFLESELLSWIKDGQ